MSQTLALDQDQDLPFEEDPPLRAVDTLEEWAEEGKDARDRTLRIETGPDPAQGRSTVEQALSWHAKRYDSVSETAEGGVSTVLYRIRLKKSTTSDQFLERFRASAADAIRKAEFID